MGSIKKTAFEQRLEGNVSISHVALKTFINQNGIKQSKEAILLIYMETFVSIPRPQKIISLGLL